eukprot:CAMPEP_0172439500 /NCGR_PEP_ID=MMETSP1065-20121228/467_1 /TAXON_ID=265537 /ORGANISM="Amphiprora paludosa, Strain CCMP125" /LENGTH=73 /DNA_ID=CAMNT_0013188187 /DNA_START=240 /DNA_END=461 /DNA_ORIENTATION=-
MSSSSGKKKSSNTATKDSIKHLSVLEQIEILKKQERRKQEATRARLGIGKHAKRKQEKDLKELGFKTTSSSSS